MLNQLIKPKCLLILFLFNTGCSVFGIQSEESPEYKTLLTVNKIQIRQYSPYIIAKTKVKGVFDNASSEGFKILAGYIFGDNIANKKISENSTAINAKEVESSKIAMTAPVTMKSVDTNSWVMSFSMPSKYDLETLPRPNDKRITLEKVDKKTFAVLTFSGSWNESKNKQKAEELKKWIVDQKKYNIKSQPAYAGYNPPWTIPIFKKNEVLIEISY